MTSGPQTGQSVKCDWLAFTLPNSERDKALELVQAFAGPGELAKHGIHTYAQMIRFEAGGVVAWTEGRAECFVSLNGDTCDLLPAPALLAFIQAMGEIGGTATRCDLALDDYTRKLVVLADFHQAAEAGNFCGFRVHQSIQERTRRGDLLSDAHTFGRKGKAGSGRQVVVYDKALESGGKINSTRVEARFFKEAAALLVEALASSFTVDRLERKMRAAIGGAIDFRDRQQKHRHISRMERLAWWQKIVDLLDAAPVVVHHNKPPLQEALEYCRDTWATNFALLFEIAESHGLDGDSIITQLTREMVDKGKRKLDAGYRPGVRALGIDFVELLSG